MREFEEERRRRREEGEVRGREVARRGKPLFEKYEERYREEVELPGLEEKKKALEEKRNLYRPIDKRELEEHKVKYEAVKREKQEEIRRVREESLKAEREHKEKIKHLMRENVEEQKGKEEEIQIAEEKRRLHEKKKNYAKNVKEMFWPRVSEEKRQEIEHLKDPNLRQSVLRLK